MAPTTAVRVRAGRMLGVVERLAGTRRGPFILAVAAVAVYAFESIGWPLQPGRDLGVYLRYWAQLGQGDPVFPWSMLTRTPVAPLVAGGLLAAGGGLAAEVVMALLFAASILAWSIVALTVGGRRAALLVAVALVAYPGYGGLFHELSSDAVFAAGFAGWALLVTRALARGSLRWFAAAGGGVALLALTRPANQAVILVAPLVLLLPGSWRLRGARIAAFLAAAVIPLAGWAAVNDLRYGDFSVARGGDASVPYFRAFVTDRIVGPDNGPASRRLAEAVRTQLLPREPYRSYGIDLHEFFSSGSARMQEDTIGLSDRVFGWDSDYAVLGKAAREGVRRHLGTYVHGVASSMWQELSKPLFVPPRPVPAPKALAPRALARAAPKLPTPSEGEPIPAARQGAYVSTPDAHIREVWTSATEHTIVFDDPRDQQRFNRLNERMAELVVRFPTRRDSGWLRLQLNHASKAYPPLWLWLLAGVIGLAWRRPATPLAPIVLTAAALILLLATVLGVYSVPEYAVPVAPSFILLGAVGLVGRRARANA